MNCKSGIWSLSSDTNSTLICDTHLFITINIACTTSMDAQAPQTTVHTNGTVHALLFLAFIVFVAVLDGLTFALYVLFAIPMLVHDVCTLVWGRFPFVDAIYHGITQQSGNWVKHDGGAYAEEDPPPPRPPPPPPPSRPIRKRASATATATATRTL